MRWNEVCTLVGNPNRYQDQSGAWHEGEPARVQVFCNRYTVGADSWATSVDAGLRPEGELQLRACDYRGEPEVVLDGTEYDVGRVSVSGDFVRLTLERHVTNDG